MSMSNKIRLGKATRQGQPIFSRKASGIVYKDASKIGSPDLPKCPIPGVTRRKD